MALDVDSVIDRRRLSRRVTLWRALAIIAVIGGIIAGVLSQVGLRGPHVARITIQGPIVAERPLLQLIERIRKRDDVAGVVVSINSPGGTAVGGERLYEALRKLDQQKPIVAHINAVAASAGYMIALASDHIVAHRTSLTGSIGVLIQYGSFKGLLDKLGVDIGKVDSGPLKAEPSPFEAVDPRALAALQSVVDDTFEFFLGLVIDRRDMERAKAQRLADGRIFTGKQAADDGLIDAIGDEATAVAWLVEERNVPKGLSVRNYRPSRQGDNSLSLSLADRLVNRVLTAMGLPVDPQLPLGSVDGLWSIWQASPTPQR